MTAFNNAKKFFHTCETAKGWNECKLYATEDASFVAQSEHLVSINTSRDYCEWMARFAGITVPGGSYTIHSSSYDEETKTAIFFATYHAKHTGEGGPIPATQKETHSHYVMAITINAENKVEKLVKIWNAP